MDRPNILWLTYEDTSPQFVSCYGRTTVATTPNIDSLAAGGVRFTRAFATAPVCSASRSALITGVCNEATGLGHHRSKYPIPRGLIKGFPCYLKQAGYYASNNVKTDYNIVDEVDFIAETWNESSTTAHWRDRAADQPFLSVFNYMDSHQSRTMTEPWGWYEEHVLGRLAAGERISPDDVVMPPIYRDNEEMRRHVSRVYNALRLCDKRIGERLEELRSDGLMDDTIIFCFADHGEGIPRGKFNAIGFGYRASFVAWFPEKYRHLSPWGAGTECDELVSFEDLAPTILSVTGVPVPGHMTGRVIVGPDRRPEPECLFAARNRIDDTPDLCRSAIDRRFVYTRVYYPHLPVQKYQKYSDVSDILRAIRRDYAAGLLDDVQGEIVAPTRPVEYLYDLEADPWEVRNLAGDPAYSGDLERLRAVTIEHARTVRDVMFLPERIMVEDADGSTPYERRFDETYNPLDALLEAAGLVGNPDAVERQCALVGDDAAAVRYWAAVGLNAAARSDALPGMAVTAIANHLDDPTPEVRIELAAALLAQGAHGLSPGIQAARRVLGTAITDPDPLIAHQAVSRVLYLPTAAPAFAAAVESARARSDTEATIRGNRFPLEQAIDMYRYLYAGEPLYYERDLPYVQVGDRVRDW
jgi:arylsulfatase A-like enzyme